MFVVEKTVEKQLHRINQSDSSHWNSLEFKFYIYNFQTPSPVQGSDTKTVIAVILHMSHGNEANSTLHTQLCIVFFCCTSGKKTVHSVVIAET